MGYQFIEELAFENGAVYKGYLFKFLHCGYFRSVFLMYSVQHIDAANVSHFVFDNKGNVLPFSVIILLPVDRETILLLLKKHWGRS